MPGALNHRPSKIIKQLLIDLELGTESGEWPVKAGNLPDLPDDVIVVYDTQGDMEGRYMIDGERQGACGFSVTVRSLTKDVAYEKALEIALALDDKSNVYRRVVTLDDSDYCLHSVNRKTDVLDAGFEKETSKRVLMTVNATSSIRMGG